MEIFFYAWISILIAFVLVIVGVATVYVPQFMIPVLLVATIVFFVIH